MLKKTFSKTKPVCKVTFTLPVEAAKDAKDVRILGEFNDWSWENGYKMNPGKEAFSKQIELEAGKSYEFRYLIDNHKWENDWEADNYVTSPFTGITNSVVVCEGPGKKTASPSKKTTAGKSRNTSAKAASDVAAPTAKAAKPIAKKAVKKAPSKKMSGKADQLTRIEGIGPKIASLLNAAGIVSFQDLANAKPATLKGILQNAGKRYQMHDPGTWAAQAKLAAQEDWAKLKEMQTELKGGK